MTRRKKSRSRSRSGGFKVRRSSRRSSGSGGVSPVYALAYGALRPPISNWMRGIASQLPLVSQFGDTGALLATAWVVNKWGPSAVRPLAKAAFNAELVLLGQQLSGGLFGGMSNSSGGLTVAI